MKDRAIWIVCIIILLIDFNKFDKPQGKLEYVRPDTVINFPMLTMDSHIETEFYSYLQNNTVQDEDEMYRTLVEIISEKN